MEKTIQIEGMMCQHCEMHVKKALEALPQVIEYFQAAGFTFEAIDKSSWVCHHIVEPPETTTTQNQDDAENDGENEEDTGEGEEEEQA